MVSKASRSDYSVYRLESSKCVRLVAIVDAKAKLTIDSIAQLIGYYISYEVSDDIPIVAVISSEFLRILTFPFKHHSDDAVNALLFPAMPININGIPDLEVFKFISRYFKRKKSNKVIQYASC